MELILLLMVLFTQVNDLATKKMAKAHLIILIVIAILEISQMAKRLVLAYTITLMEIAMKENGVMTNVMG